MDNKEMYDFIERHLGEPLSNREKKGLEKLAKRREQEKMYAFMEQHLGEPLSAQSKELLSKWEKGYNKCVVTKAKSMIAANCRQPQRSFLWRYAATVVASVVLCLSIVLPITLGNTKTVPYPMYIDNTPPVEIPRYTTDVQTLKLVQGDLKAVDGLLLFANEQYGYDECGEFIYGETCIESSKKDGRVLSYTINGGLIAIDFQPFSTMEVFQVDYRIRTYKYYYFENYYKDFYATLEKTYCDYKTDVTNENELYKFNNIEKQINPELADNNTSETITVYALIYNGIVAVFYTTEDITVTYFEYNSNDYCIKITPIDFSAVTGKEFSPDVDYIKNKFLIQTLFANL